MSCWSSPSGTPGSLTPASVGSSIGLEPIFCRERNGTTGGSSSSPNGRIRVAGSKKRLGEAFAETDQADARIAVFTGTTGQDRREEVKAAFNTDPAKEPLRILICTDAAREEINLQTYCSDLIHFDLPWNPSRLEQRNGRIDRKLQPAKQVHCRYFRYEQREADIVLDALVRKTEHHPEATRLSRSGHREADQGKA